MRPRVVLAVSISPLEWRIRPQLEEWADVAMVERGADLGQQLDTRGWDACVLVGDEWGALVAMELADRAPQRVQGIAIGHACLYEPGARQRDVEPEIWDAYKSLARLDYRSFARALTQVSGGSYGDEIVDQFLATVPHERVTAYLDAFDHILDEGSGLKQRLRTLGTPLLLAQHEKCLLWTRAGFDAARRALPEARTIVVEDKPSVSPEFADALREFCGSIEWGAGS